MTETGFELHPVDLSIIVAYALLMIGLGLVLAGFIAALMSQIDSTLNSASTLVTMDFVRRAKPDLNPHQLMRVGQVATFLFMILAVAWALQIENFGSLFKYLQRILAYAVPPVVTMFLAGMFWRPANSTGAVATIVAGLVGGATLFVISFSTNSVDLHFLYIAPLLFIVCTAAMIVVSLVTAAPPAEKVASMTWSPQFFRDETAERARRGQEIEKTLEELDWTTRVSDFLAYLNHRGFEIAPGRPA